MEGLFGNIGRKLKILATVIFAIVLIFILALGIIAMVTIYDGVGFIVGLPLILFAFPIAWCSAALLYAFGEMVDKLAQIEKNTRE